MSGFLFKKPFPFSISNTSLLRWIQTSSWMTEGYSSWLLVIHLIWNTSFQQRDPSSPSDIHPLIHVFPFIHALTARASFSTPFSDLSIKQVFFSLRDLSTLPVKSCRTNFFPVFVIIITCFLFLINSAFFSLIMKFDIVMLF